MIPMHARYSEFYKCRTKTLNIFTTHRRDVDTVNKYVTKPQPCLNKTRSFQCRKF